jgi:hypothetical protein
MNVDMKVCIDEGVFAVVLAIFRALRPARDDVEDKKNPLRSRDDEFVGEFVIEIAEDFAAYKFINIIGIPGLYITTLLFAITSFVGEILWRMRLLFELSDF